MRFVDCVNKQVLNVRFAASRHHGEDIEGADFV
jgi:hypothetical protein